MRILPPLIELTLARFREFWREPGAVFWVYGFPVLLIVGLGLAFPGRPPRPVVDVVAGPEAETTAALLRDAGLFEVRVLPEDEARARHRRQRVDLVVIAQEGGFGYLADETRAEGALARALADEVLQRSRGRRDAVVVRQEAPAAQGARYIDWLLPGLLGMNIMGGGLWGVGFAIVDMRVRKLLKRLRATPMRRRDFLLALLGSRLLFLIPEVAAILLVGRLLFGVGTGDQVAALLVSILVGSFAFSGIGLLVACRTARIETASGLMNLVMLPMWILSGVFFSAERFPDVMQPLVQALPLTQLLNALRGAMLEGVPPSGHLLAWGILLGTGGLSFALALRAFRWT
jgi:ABC-2 type transport system permease protein